MKMKIKDLLQAGEAIKQLPDMPFKPSYRIGRIAKRIASDWQSITKLETP